MVRKEWNRFDRDDPNFSINFIRASHGLPPIDDWNIGVEYTYKGIYSSSNLSHSLMYANLPVEEDLW